MNSRLAITLLCAAAVAFACGPRSRTEASLVTTHAKRHAASATGDTATINGDFAVNVQPHALRFALNVTNAGRKNVELTFPSGQQYDFAVVDARGREVYRWGATRMFTQSLQNKSLDGGDTLRIDESADLALPHGRYVAVATLRSSNYPVQQRAEFELR